MKFLKLLAFSIVVCASFVYGLGVGSYHWFPFEQIKQLKQSSVETDFTFSRFGARNDVLSYDATREVISCPPASDRLGVLVSFGQSNSANSADYLVKSDEVPNVINWYEGKCYEAKSPLLGATGKNGEWITLTAQSLVDNGTYDQVVILSLGVGGSPIAAWSKGSELNDRLLSEIAEIRKMYNVTDMIWHQGETDFEWRVSSEQYVDSFSSLEESIRNAGVMAPIFMSIASYCNGGEYPNAITYAQNSLVDMFDGVELGVNTDELISTRMRREDGCHFNKHGQMAASQALARIISTFHE
ncbi:sialate O-acetylesterase [Vibrio alginolyticus]